ncbi:hypothetical protein JAAARDRAFT_142283 [Jaapia argillacea MUCL 33604]|uniref:Plasma-membrane choline transporter-domain-containing protein n=1 Tax=Jaapia argillacea MUCL 33604 TaxID=933084 RepID=A0A067PGS0_9AGAM|nr:hypothetical protein JAAARDRAFT_142283 [Jaapia argillacea MUCL 33604]
MAASFAAYASQFLHRQQNVEASMSSSQPLFFSFTTDNGSRGAINHDTDLDDLDDPHLRGASEVEERVRGGYEIGDDDDPYLRLDEEDGLVGGGRGGGRDESHSVPLLQSHAEQNHGWLAHASPLRSPSPLSTSSEETSSPQERFLEPPRTMRNHPPPPPPPPRTAISLSLTESLLPRDGTSRPMDVFSLPDPRHITKGRRKYNDSIWTALWCTGVGLCYFFSILLLFLTHKPSNPERAILPYTTLLHTVPLLTIITFLSAIVSYAHIFVLRIFAAPVVIATSVFIPATLFISAVWAFVGSFMWDADQEPTWGETVGLRLFSIIPLALSILTARRLVHLPQQIHSTSSLLNLTTRLLIANPFLLALSPAILLTSLLASLPFLTLIFRLLLIGYVRQKPEGWEWHVMAWADWAIVGTVGVWLWSWGVARGLLRVTTAGVIGAWYYSDPALPPPPPTSTHTIHAALTRSTQPSLGSITLSALILTSIRLLVLLSTFLRIIPHYLPVQLRPVAMVCGLAATYLESATGTLSGYALVYVGLTGDRFWVGARRSRVLVGVAEGGQGGRYKKRFQTEPPLTLLTIAPLTLTFPFALTTYLFVAHTLGAPEQALGAAVLAGGVTALVGLFCVGLVKDTADTLYLCYCIDKDVGEKRRPEVFDTFEYENRRTTVTPQRPQTQTPHIQPRIPQRPQSPPQPRKDPRHQPQQQPRQPTPQRAREPLMPIHHEDAEETEEDPNPFLVEAPLPQSYLSNSGVTSPGQSQSRLTSPPNSRLRHHVAGGGDLESGMLTSKEEAGESSEGEGEGEDSQMFPGSDFF